MSTASQMIIDQWIVAVEVAPAAPQPLPAPDCARLYAADVQAEADRRYSRPYRLTLAMRREIAAWLDEQDEKWRAAMQYTSCTPARMTLTGR